ncbi:restriction endonuclease subunit S [Pseudomonas cremoris]|uniref:restriction endonuclease subunit S n=1 Tax=Pseudomonas cremoris TaxID=2724178 RepID=UPI00289E8302|nr:restriction endonuclease subunit S [Pseudomonas cremoris]
MSSEWYSGKLGEVIELKRGYDLPQAKRKKGNVPLVSSSGVSDSHDIAMVKGPGVVTGRYGTIGKVFYVEDDFWPLNTTLYVRDFKGNDPKFIHYFLKTVDFLAYSDKAAVPGVNRNHLHEAAVHLPAVSEQREIAEFLGAIDDRITLLRETNATLEAIAQALFKSWFVDFDPVRAKAAGLEPEGMDAATAGLFPDSFEDSELGFVPKGWRIGSILDIANLISGGTPKTDRVEYWGGDIPWASAKDVSQAAESVLIETERTITALGLHKSSTKMIPEFSTVVVARGATTGRMVMFGMTMAMNQTCYALESKAGTPVALYLVLKKEIDALTQKAHGSVFDTITTSTFSASKTLQIPDALLACFENVAGPLFRRILAGTQQAKTLTQLRDTLLPRLISGQLRLPEAQVQIEEACA